MVGIDIVKLLRKPYRNDINSKAVFMNIKDGVTPEPYYFATTSASSIILPQGSCMKASLRVIASR